MPAFDSKRVIPTPDQAMFAAKLARDMEFCQQLQDELEKVKETRLIN
jgi:hypothetical protein